jgi:hypothetical protein
MASLAEQLRELLLDWRELVVEDAGQRIFDLTQERCPVGETGSLKESGSVAMSGEGQTSIVYEAEHASYTDEGTEAHLIQGNPLLAFFWEKLGADVVFRSVMWEPGEKVAANIGWFSDAVSEDRWSEALLESMDAIAL